MPIKFDKARWQAIQVILDQILEVPQRERRVLLIELCGPDTDLLNDVKTLIDKEDGALTYLERPALEMVDAETMSPMSTPNRIGAQLGAFQLCEIIGQGGMGVVYRAERRLGDFDQQVAIKLLSNWQARPERFQLEQQTLAKLEHPNIARLYDGGIFQSQPYLVMEYVRGVPIVEYCQRHPLTIDERLELLLQVCSALDYAHSHLVVHRDIKSSNILVSDDRQIKLLDFGIVKLLDEDDRLNLTQTGDQFLTPAFATPEQLMNKPVTVATDVYQLGLLLYELITSKKAYQTNNVDLASLVRQICEREPALPSVAAADSGSGGRKKVESELDSIVMKMLSIDPSERYSSMGSLVADITAYRECRPISAMPHSMLYHWRKMVRRNWKSLVVVISFATLLCAYAITTTIQSKQVSHALNISLVEQQKAQKVADFMINIFKAADPNVAGLEKLTAQDLLERGEKRLKENAGISPVIKGHMLTSLGEIYYSQGNMAKSVSLLNQALAKQRVANTEDTLATAKILTQLGIVHAETANFELAEGFYKQSMTIHERTDSHSEQSYAVLLYSKGQLALRKGSLKEAESLLWRSIKRLQVSKSNENEHLAVAHNSMAHYQTITGQLEQAKQSMQAALAAHKSGAGEHHSFYTVYLNNLGSILLKLEDFNQAQVVFDKALELQRQLLNENHPYIVNTLRNLGGLAYQRGNLPLAEVNFKRALDMQKRLSMHETLMTATLHQQLGQVLSVNNVKDEAEKNFKAMLKMYKELGSGDHLKGLGICALAQHYYHLADYQTATHHYQRALQLLDGTKLQFAVAQVGLAQTELAQNNLKRAADLAQAALNTRREELAVGHSLVIEAQALVLLIDVASKSRQGGDSPSNLQEQLTQMHRKLEQFPRTSYGGQNALLSQIGALINR
ncbi:MAG: protein kinase [Acidiferrobacterales bacterium]|nr:protein kinase [Acidiferrobacterales bacterium]